MTGVEKLSALTTATPPPTPETISQNLKTIHTIVVDECQKLYKPNSIQSEPAPDISLSEQTVPHKTRRILAQLCTGKSPILRSHLHKIDPVSHPSPTYPLCNSQDHTTQYLFSCPKTNTTPSVVL